LNRYPTNHLNESNKQQQANNNTKTNGNINIFYCLFANIENENNVYHEASGTIADEVGIPTATTALTNIGEDVHCKTFHDDEEKKDDDDDYYDADLLELDEYKQQDYNNSSKNDNKPDDDSYDNSDDDINDDTNDVPDESHTNFDSLLNRHTVKPNVTISDPEIVENHSNIDIGQNTGSLISDCKGQAIRNF
jgi:hypothetical protein